MGDNTFSGCVGKLTYADGLIFKGGWYARDQGAMISITWRDVEKELNNLIPVEGGFSRAQRGMLTLSNDTQVFVKVGLHDNTKRWARKEIAVYRFLHKHAYPHVPELLAVNDDETGFALTALTSDEGWDWQDHWSEARLRCTLDAMDMLAAITPGETDLAWLSDKTVDDSDDGWGPLAESPDLQTIVLGKLRHAGRDDIAGMLDFPQRAEQSTAFAFHGDALVHNDVRADNGGWNPRLRAVKLVDWNWMHLGDRRIDLASTLVHVQQSGLDVTHAHCTRLDPDALHWLAGYWFKSAATPIWPGGPEHLRDIQLQAGLTALTLSRAAS